MPIRRVPQFQWGQTVTGTTPARGVRVRDDLWQAAKDTADQRNETVTDVIVRALEQYVAASRQP